MTHTLYIVEVIGPASPNKFRIIEKVNTVDGIRDRITAHSYATLELAEDAVRKAVENG